MLVITLLIGFRSGTNYDYSKQIGARKIDGLKECGASQIATACPGCIMQLQDSINHAELPITAIHILELLEEALKDRLT